MPHGFLPFCIPLLPELAELAEEGWRDSLIEAGAPGAKREPDRAKPQLVVSSAETSRRSDHPGCAASVASRHSFDGAATPPLRGGEYFREPPRPRSRTP